MSSLFGIKFNWNKLDKSIENEDIQIYATMVNVE